MKYLHQNFYIRLEHDILKIQEILYIGDVKNFQKQSAQLDCVCEINFESVVWCFIWTQDFLIHKSENDSK